MGFDTIGSSFMNLMVWGGTFKCLEIQETEIEKKVYEIR